MRIGSEQQTYCQAIGVACASDITVTILILLVYKSLKGEICYDLFSVFFLLMKCKSTEVKLITNKKKFDFKICIFCSDKVDKSKRNAN